MIRRLAKFLVVIALTFSLGAHWFVLQSLGWGSMIVQNLQELPLATALSRTFDGKHLCKICKFVREGKQTEKKNESIKVESEKKIFVRNGLAVPAPSFSFFVYPNIDQFASPRSEVPLLPPPKHFLL